MRKFVESYSRWRLTAAYGREKVDLSILELKRVKLSPRAPNIAIAILGV